MVTFQSDCTMISPKDCEHGCWYVSVLRLKSVKTPESQTRDVMV